MSSSSLMAPSSTKGSVTMRLSQLQNLCKRDPLGYSDDYKTQLNRFNASLSILDLNPGQENEDFVELLQFICAVVSKSYKEDGDDVAEKVMKVLAGKCDELHPDTRRACAQSLILMRNR
jgi:protein SDA1